MTLKLIIVIQILPEKFNKTVCGVKDNHSKLFMTKQRNNPDQFRAIQRSQQHYLKPLVAWSDIHVLVASHEFREER